MLFFPGPNQVDTFLSEHGGPGIQHIGLYSPDLVPTVSTLRKSGVEFINPPKAYYSEVIIPVLNNYLRFTPFKFLKIIFLSFLLDS